MKSNILARIFILLTITITFFSCKDDDPITPAEDHFEAIGMVFYTSGIEIGRILRGQTSDTLEAPEGGLSEHIDIKFFDENENIIDPPDNKNKTLSWEIGNSQIADIWQHEGEEGSFEFHLKGLKQGKTTIEFFILHEGHSDYRSGKIPVKIGPSTDDAHGDPVGLNLLDEESGDIILSINNGTVSGNLNVPVNTITEHMEVEFFDDNGVTFEPSSPPHTLSVVAANENIASITGQENDEPWAFKVEGKSKGTTTITIKLLHDGVVAKEFTPISVNVN